MPKELQERSDLRIHRRKRIINSIAFGLLLLALAFGVSYYLHTLSRESTDDAFIEANIVAVSTRVDGQVARVNVADNQWVKEGQLLVELDPRLFEARLNAAKAALEAAKATDRARSIAVDLTIVNATAGLNEAKDNVESKKAGVQESLARLALAKATLEQARAEADSARARYQLDLKDLKRYQAMAKTQTVSEKDLEHAEAAEQISAANLTAANKNIDTLTAAVQEAEASLKAARANLSQANARMTAAQSAPQQIMQSRSQAEVARAEMDRTEAEAAQARLNLSYTNIYAPCDGFVTKKGIEVGQFVQEGQALLAIVPRKVWVTANFKETQLTRLRTGQSVNIKVDAYPDVILHGQVESLQHGTGARFSLLPAENATGNFVKVVQRVPVKIVLNQKAASDRILLVPGMSVVAEVNIGEEGVKRVPSQNAAQDNAPTSGANGIPTHHE